METNLEKKTLDMSVVSAMQTLYEKNVQFTTPFSEELTDAVCQGLLSSIYDEQSVKQVMERFPTASRLRTVIVSFLAGVDVQGEIKGLNDVISTIITQTQTEVVAAVLNDDVIQRITSAVSEGLRTELNSEFNAINNLPKQVESIAEAQSSINNEIDSIKTVQTGISNTLDSIKTQLETVSSTVSTCGSKIDEISKICEDFITTTDELLDRWNKTSGEEVKNLKDSSDNFSTSMRALSGDVKDLITVIEGAEGVRASLSSLTQQCVSNYSKWLEYAAEISNDKLQISQGSQSLSAIIDQINEFIQLIPTITDSFNSAGSLINMGTYLTSEIQKQTERWVSASEVLENRVREVQNVGIEMNKSVVKLVDGNNAIKEFEQDRFNKTIEAFNKTNQQFVDFSNSVAEVVKSKLANDLDELIKKQIAWKKPYEEVTKDVLKCVESSLKSAESVKTLTAKKF